MAQLRADIAQRQLLSAVSGSAAAPDAEVKPLYDAEFEKRSADMARVSAVRRAGTGGAG